MPDITFEVGDPPINISDWVFGFDVAENVGGRTVCQLLCDGKEIGIGETREEAIADAKRRGHDFGGE